MKLLKLFLALLSLTLLMNCEPEEETAPVVDVPSTFSVDIPPSLSSATASGIGGRVDATNETIEGEDIYEALRYYIYLGEQSAEILEFVLVIGSTLNEGNVVSVTFPSDDDFREKRIDITNDVVRGGVEYAYEMTMVDTENEDMALQMLWNTNPVEGIAILNPYNLDRSEDANPEAFYRIDYTEANPSFEEAMTVYISGAEVEEVGDPDNLIMFAGRNGDIVEVIGNSNHPDLTIIDPDYTGGRNYAFVARGDESTDLGVVNLWLPPSDVTTNDFEAGDQYSVYQVLEAEIEAVADLEQEVIDAILAEALSPAYFNNAGFITSGADNKPESFSDAFVNLTGNTPFVPNDVQNLSIGFIE